jgi:broad specificity phosphatase PhoE
MTDTARLYLVRHAAAAAGEDSDPPLSEVGRWQAGALGKRFAELGPATVLHSPKRRAQETALSIVDRIVDAAVLSDDALDDRTPVPSAKNRSAYDSKYWNWLASTPHDEQDIDGERIDRATRQLAAAARDGDRAIVAITHAFVIAWIVQQVLGSPTGSWMGLTPANASLTVVDCADSRMHLISYNDTGHLTTGHG